MYSQIFDIIIKVNAGSSNGRTTASGAVNLGSSPGPARVLLLSFTYV